MSLLNHQFKSLFGTIQACGKSLVFLLCREHLGRATFCCWVATSSFHCPLQCIDKLVSVARGSNRCIRTSGEAVERVCFVMLILRFETRNGSEPPSASGAKLSTSLPCSHVLVCSRKKTKVLSNLQSSNNCWAPLCIPFRPPRLLGSHSTLRTRSSPSTVLRPCRQSAFSSKTLLKPASHQCLCSRQPGPPTSFLKRGMLPLPRKCEKQMAVPDSEFFALRPTGCRCHRPEDESLNFAQATPWPRKLQMMSQVKCLCPWQEQMQRHRGLRGHLAQTHSQKGSPQRDRS